MIGELNRRTSRKAVAVHEAGHVFVALARPNPPDLERFDEISAVWINKGRTGWEGKVEFRFPHVPLVQATAERQVLVSLAGPIAEIRWRMRCRWAAILNSSQNAKIAASRGHESSSDFGTAMDCLRYNGHNDLETAFSAAWLEAEAIVNSHWGRIIAFANRLKCELRLEGEALDELISTDSAQCTEQAFGVRSTMSDQRP